MMSNIVDLLESTYKEDIEYIESKDATTEGIKDKLAILSKAIGPAIGIKGYTIDLITHQESDYIAYKFRDSSSLICKAGFPLNREEFQSDLINSIGLIEDGIASLNILNEALDSAQLKEETGRHLYYKWARGSKCSLGTWNYNTIRVKLSYTSIDLLISKYREGPDKFNKFISKIIKAGKADISLDIISFIEKFDSLSINKQLKAKIVEGSLQGHLSNSMLSRSEVLGVIAGNTNKFETQQYQSMEIVEGLGSFACIVIWDVDFNSHSIHISLLDDQALDIAERCVTTNQGIISKLEQEVEVTEHEMDFVFCDKPLN